MKHNFSNNKNIATLPNLSNVQLDSYKWLMTEGINEVLEELGTIEDYTGRGWILSLTDFKVEKPNISMEDAVNSGRTYDAPWYLKATLEDPINKKKKKIEIEDE